MKKKDVINIIDDVMNNREIDSIRNAILAIRDKVKEFPDETEYRVTLELCSDNPLCITDPWFEGAKYVTIDMIEKIDTGHRGAVRYHKYDIEV